MTAPLLLYYDDKEIDCDSTSFLVGRDILTACILDEGVNETEVYLPKNEIWYLNDKVYDGGTSVMLNIPPDGEVPYFVRGGSVIATDEGEYGFKSSEKLRLTVYPLRSGSFKSEFFTDDGESFAYKTGDCVHLLFTVDCDSEYVRVRIENIGEKSFTPDISALRCRRQNTDGRIIHCKLQKRAPDMLASAYPGILSSRPVFTLFRLLPFLFFRAKHCEAHLAAPLKSL